MKENQVKMLPHKFKLIGLSILLLVILIEVFRRNFSIPFAVQNAVAVKNTTLNLLILGLLFIAWAKDKMEDERTIQLKVQALAGSFIFGGIYVVMHSITNQFLSDPLPEETGRGFMIYLLFMHLSLFYLQKFNDWQYEKKR